MCDWSCESIWQIGDVMCKECIEQEVTVKFVIGDDFHHYKSFTVKCEHGSYTWNDKNYNSFEMTFENNEGECGMNPLIRWLDYFGTIMFT